ncbi:MAG: RHS repeat-associated core domain-containing protein [Chloroflexota bacterium]|nr:RHS repeat-associated core domain-containing protein [Chloroflexota bacterium]
MVQSVDGDVTTFAWDWASGVPEMLSEGGNLYLVGHETLGQWDGATWAYHLPDALGSVRQEVGGAGAVASTREWTPFGVELGVGQAGLGYTGEWWDVSVGLQYLRARWYDGRVGRFTRRDPWEGNHQQPLTMNPYLYALANSINHTDPSGLYTYFTNEDIEGIQEIIWNPLMESAVRHNVSGSNMGNGALAALLATLLMNERGQWAFRPGNDYNIAAAWSQDFLGLLIPHEEWCINLIKTLGLDESIERGADKALGFGNIQESTIASIMQGHVRMGELDPNGPGILQYDVDYNLYALGGCQSPCRNMIEMNDLIILNARRIANLDWWHTLDMMGAVVQEGIYNMQFHGEDPAVFNLITRHSRNPNTLSPIL